MFNSRLTLISILLSSLCLTSVASLATGHAAKAIFAVGDVKVIDATGAGRALRKGDFVFPGDTVATEEGRAQIQFTDGGMASLQDNTQYRIDEYNYPGRVDGSERSFFNLVIGTVRFVTGAVGSGTKKNFRIKTKVATIGIRGSGGLLKSCIAGSCAGLADGTYLTTYLGILTLLSGPFSGDVHPGESYHCNSAGSGCSKIDTEGAAQATQIPVPEFDQGYRQGEQQIHSPEGHAHPSPGPSPSPSPGYSPGM